MSGFTPNLALEAEMIRLRRIAEWQYAAMQAGTQGPALGGVMSQAEQYRQSALSQQAQNVPDIRQAVTQAMGSLAVLLERSRCVLGQSLIGIGAFVDPVAEPVVVAASKPVNRALARAMGCGSRQAIGFMVR